MESPVLKIIIQFDRSQNGRDFTGAIILHSWESVCINRISATIYLETRGELSNENRKLIDFNVLTESMKLEAAESYNIPFKFSIKPTISTYKGTNVDFVYRCDVNTEVDESDFHKLEMSVYSNVKSFITSNRLLKNSRYFKVKLPEAGYKVVESQSLFHVKNDFKLLIAVAVFIGIPVLWLTISLAMPVIVTCIILSMGIARFFTWAFLQYLLSDISMKPVSTESGFDCVITSKYNPAFISSRMYYQVLEQFINSTNDSNSYDSQTSLYTSKKRTIGRFKKSNLISFKYPQKPENYSLELGNASIIWRMNLVGVTLIGIPIELAADFRVKRDDTF